MATFRKFSFSFFEIAKIFQGIGQILALFFSFLKKIHLDFFLLYLSCSQAWLNPLVPLSEQHEKIGEKN
jgi:hypothetical protein